MISRKRGKPDTAVPPDTDDDLTRGATEPESTTARHRRKPAHRILLFLSIILVGAVTLATVGLYVLTDSVANQVVRTPNVFTGLDEAARPPATEAMTFLLIGTDSLDPDHSADEPPKVTFEPGSQRSDVIMLVRLDKDRSKATVVSLPRDSWVTVPGYGNEKINAAYSFGGPSLLVRTVEALTHIRVDHFGVIDFAGFQSVIDLVGGIDVTIDAATTAGGVSFHEGVNHLSGLQALSYVRQRKGLPRGDLDRVRRHQNALRALVTKIASSTTLSHPADSYRLLDTLSQWVRVDDTFTNNGLRSFVFGLRDLRPTQVTFLTAPVGGLGREGSQSVVYLELDLGSALWHALGTGQIDAYVVMHPEGILGVSSP
jgi:LCP family protein required for cell wall assembly